MTLNYGGNKVSKLYYGSKDVSGNFKLESGTVLYEGAISNTPIHLKNGGDSWETFKMVTINVYSKDYVYLNKTIDINDIPKKFALGPESTYLTLSKTIVNGKYGLKAEISFSGSILKITVV